MRNNPFLIGAALTFVFGPAVHAGTIGFTGAVVDYTISTTGEYAIVAFGAQGGGTPSLGAGGLGAEIGGQFLLDAGDVLEIAVGGQGGHSLGFIRGAGGGGGSFVFDETTGALLIAGGGGGGGPGPGAGGDGQTTTSGESAFGGGVGGASGLGGNALAENAEGGGGGFLGSGGGISSGVSGGGGGSWPGLAGGSPFGAFVGGGGGGVVAGGGGGGYSGGGGGGGQRGVGGGGGSYLSSLASNPILMGGVQSGDGLVTITPSAVPEPATWAMMLTGFAGLGFVGYRHKRKGGAPTVAA